MDPDIEVKISGCVHEAAPYTEKWTPTGMRAKCRLCGREIFAPRKLARYKPNLNAKPKEHMSKKERLRRRREENKNNA